MCKIPTVLGSGCAPMAPQRAFGGDDDGGGGNGGGVAAANGVAAMVAVRVAAAAAMAREGVAAAGRWRRVGVRCESLSIQEAADERSTVPTHATMQHHPKNPMVLGFRKAVTLTRLLCLHSSSCTNSSASSASASISVAPVSAFPSESS